MIPLLAGLLLGGKAVKVVIAGGTGFIGKKLTEMLVEKGHEVLILTRKKRKPAGKVTYITWFDGSPETEIGHADAFINLAGVSINDGRWSEKHQKQIYESRMTATSELLRIIGVMDQKPSVWINASAIGIYPASLETVYTEKSVEVADDFLGRTVSDWEKVASGASDYSIRTVFMRFGVVLGTEGGALPLMVLPYKLFAGGTVGSGRQWVSWVHVTDVVRAIMFVLEKEVSGPVNVSAPYPIRMKEFGKTIGAVLHRPHWFPAPAFMMKLALGKKSSLVLEGQQVLPDVLLKAGFQFEFPELKEALRDLLL